MRVAFANVYCAQQWNANLLKKLHVYQHTLFHCKFNINLAAVERLPALHYSVDFIFLSFGIMGFIVEL